jgi:hypothetical protein
VPFPHGYVHLPVLRTYTWGAPAEVSIPLLRVEIHHGSIALTFDENARRLKFASRKIDGLAFALNRPRMRSTLIEAI